jgi:hypothetical protein
LDPDPDPLVRGTDPGIRILTKISRIPQHLLWRYLYESVQADPCLGGNVIRDSLPDIPGGDEAVGGLLKKPSLVGFFYFCPEERAFRVFSVSRILLGASRL